MKQPVTIHLTTIQFGTGEEVLFEQTSQVDSPMERYELSRQLQEQKETEERFEMYVRGEAEVENGTYVLRYMETELTGMEGTETTITFDTDNRGCVTLLRSGEVSTALTFMKGQRSISTYETPEMPFSLCVYTMHMKNDLSLAGGSLMLEYLVEIRGAFAEQNRLLLEVLPIGEGDADIPQPLQTKSLRPDEI